MEFSTDRSKGRQLLRKLSQISLVSKSIKARISKNDLQRDSPHGPPPKKNTKDEYTPGNNGRNERGARTHVKDIFRSPTEDDHEIYDEKLQDYGITRLDLGFHDGPDEEEIRDQVQKVLSPLTQYDGNYVDPKELHSYGITCVDMDFYNGQAGTLTPYINLLPLHTIKQALKIARPWEMFDDGALDHQKKKDTSGLGSPRATASWIWGLIEQYLEHNFEEKKKGIMPTLTKWAPVSLPDSEHLSRFEYYTQEWLVEGTFRPCTDYKQRTRDPEKPHLSGFVSDRASHCEDTLLTSELLSALYLAMNTALIKTFARHEVIPVTIVSCSGRRMRVIQCIFNSRNGAIQIRKSPIVDFTDGVLADGNEDKFYTILSWIIGQPTGNTTGEAVNTVQ